MHRLIYFLLYPLHAYDAYRARQRQARRDAFVRAQDEAMGYYSPRAIVRQRPLSDRLANRKGQTIEEICREVLAGRA